MGKDTKIKTLLSLRASQVEIFWHFLRYSSAISEICSCIMKSIFLVLSVIIGINSSFSQNVPIGQWKSHLPYNGVLSVVDADEKVYCANSISVFSYVKSDNSYERLSTAAGFSEVGIRGIHYDKNGDILVIVYTNSNIDFLFGNEIYNFPFIKSGNINGDKNIYHSYFLGDTAILSCGFGIVLFDLEKRESPATYFFTDTTGANMRVNQSTVYNNAIYAATVSGLFRGDLDEPNLQDFSKWDSLSGFDGLPKGDVKYITNFEEVLYAMVADTIYKYDGTIWEQFFFDAGWKTKQLKSTSNKLLITQISGIDEPADSCRVLMIDIDGEVTEVKSSTQLSYISQSDLDKEGVLWIADSYRGLVKYKDNNYSYYEPNGPASSRVQDMASFNGTLYVAPGETDATWIYQYNRDGFFQYDEYGYWAAVNNYIFTELDTTLDFITVEPDPFRNIVYFGSYGGGLLEYNKVANTIKIYEQGYLFGTPGDPPNYRVSGLALDASGNLWISNFGAINPLVVKRTDGTWKYINPEMPVDVNNQVAQIQIDEFNTKWIQLPRGNGILVYNENLTLDDDSDDLIKVLGAGAGNGNLHTSFVNCLAVDKQGEVWVGTTEGITIFYNPSEVFSGSTAGDATQPLVSLGGFYEQLLRNDIVNTIAVDGANRKWVGTNSGAFLISEDGTQQLLYFNTDNSPLISNAVINIEIDDVTGDVYFGTANGIISFRYTATDGVEEIDKVNVFPNPVRPEYTGLIAINGLTENAEIKITDVAGRMIFETTALGGQAIWDGKGYGGDRAQTGVYLVYSSNEDGSETFVAKILMVN